MFPLGLSTGMSAAGAANQKNIYRSGTTALTISNGEMEYIMQLLKSLEESRLSIKGIGEKIKNEAKEQKDRLPSMLLGTLTASILGNALVGRDVIRAD